MEHNEDYRRGFEDGVRALADSVEKYYATLKGRTVGYLVEYTIEQKAKELLGHEDND